ncbi:PREDICTED: A disintegrin and metalloproteinase with thrombospondin motifs 9-like, partial [Priapulus caudatus]|uniref:A disintegrin and metalloproteinase with thrombospondin motifs 9-like n=1 Tax=Priapulus caudatus TaxID=37621 RepID=A0ABM1F148_PRICU
MNGVFLVAFFAAVLFNVLYLLGCVRPAFSAQMRNHHQGFRDISDEDYDITVPTRLDASGMPRADSEPHYRRRRAIEEADRWKGGGDDSTLYRIKAFGKEFTLHLTAYSDFLSPNFVVEQIIDNVTWIFRPEGLPEGNLAHCFYRGVVDEQEDSAAAVSLCHGLFGSFRTSTEEYFIEPMPSSDGDDDDV